MIEEIDHTLEENARIISDLFKESYAVEASILGVDFIPPMKLSLIDIQRRKTKFYCYRKGGSVAAILELRALPERLNIQSLVVHPAFFRQGIASKMLEFTISETTLPITVETGWKNEPAIHLYQKYGFVQTGSRIAEFDIKKLVFLKRQ